MGKYTSWRELLKFNKKYVYKFCHIRGGGKNFSTSTRPPKKKPLNKVDYLEMATSPSRESIAMSECLATPIVLVMAGEPISLQKHPES